MRQNLKKIEGVRKTFRGTFERSGSKQGWHGTEITLLFKNITDDKGNIISDHLWFNYTKGFERLSPWKQGDVVQFDARVAGYTKGYNGYREDICKPVEHDYKLSHPTRIIKMS